MPRIYLRLPTHITSAILNAVSTLDFSVDPKDTLHKLSSYQFALTDIVYLFHIALASFWITIIQVPSFPAKLLIPILYAGALLIPLSSQFFVPATPIFSYLITFYSSRFIPEA